MNMVSDNKPDQDDQGSFKDYKNVSINQIIRKSQDSKLTLPPLGVKSDSQQQQSQQQSQLSPPQPQQQADYTYSTFQAQSYDPYRQMTLPQQQSQQQQQQQQQPTYASPSQYPIPQQSFSIAAAPLQQSHVAMPQTQVPQHSILADNKRGRRFRRRYNQIVRKYPCSFPGCIKSYGSLNHLNTHIVTKKHGHRKSKADFQHSSQSKEDGSNKAGDASQYVQPGNDYTVGNYWYGYSTHLRPTTSQADSFTQQVPASQNNNYMYFQGYQQGSSTSNSTSTVTSQQSQQQQHHQPQAQQIQQQYVAQLQAATGSSSAASSIPQQRVVMGSMGYYQPQQQQQQQIPQYFAPPQLQQQSPQQSQLINNDGTQRVSGLDDNKQNQPGM
ncbi:C2H2 finger domain transcription factor CON7 [Candida tropicalis]